MEKFLAVVLLAFAIVVSANDIDVTCKQHVIYGAPVKAEGNNQYLCRTAYAVNYNYAVSVASIEQKTGINFSPLLSNNTAEKAVLKLKDF